MKRACCPALTLTLPFEYQISANRYNLQKDCSYDALQCSIRKVSVYLQTNYPTCVQKSASGRSYTKSYTKYWLNSHKLLEEGSTLSSPSWFSSVAVNWNVASTLSCSVTLILENALGWVPLQSFWFQRFTVDLCFH